LCNNYTVIQPQAHGRFRACVWQAFVCRLINFRLVFLVFFTALYVLFLYYVFCLTLSVVSYSVLCDLRLIYISQIWPDKFLFVENRNIFAPLCEPIG